MMTFSFGGGAAGFVGGASCGGVGALVCSPTFAVAGALAGAVVGKEQAGKAFDFIWQARASKKRGGNAGPNEQAERIAAEVGLNRRGRTELHRAISKMDYSPETIREIAEDLALQSKYQAKPPI